MAPTSHLLITETGQPLERFAEVFPEAKVIAFGDQAKAQEFNMFKHLGALGGHYHTSKMGQIR